MIIVLILSLSYFLFGENYLYLKIVLSGDSAPPDKSFLHTAPVNDKNAAAQDPISSIDSITSSPARILIAGDSMCEGLLRRLSDYCAYNNHNLSGAIWSSSSTVGWSSHDTLKYYINKYKADYLLFVIGSNELLTPNSKARERYIRKIEQQMAGVRSIWIGPPNWKKDKGINDLIKAIVGKDRFFPSMNLTYQRLKDGAHPTMESASSWMDSIASWIQTKSRYPLALKVPLSRSNKLRNITYLSVPKTITQSDSLVQLTEGIKQKIDTVTALQSETEINPAPETESQNGLPK
ncbi:MAG: hypothetical protein AB9882_10120 [Ignavibacteriaceae bacterium]